MEFENDHGPDYKYDIYSDTEQEEGEEEEEEAAKPQAKKQKGGKGAAVPAEAEQRRSLLLRGPLLRERGQARLVKVGRLRTR